MMTTQDTTPRAWVGCLACYNDGAMIGEWIDGIEAGEVTAEAMHRLHFEPGTGPAPAEHEELWAMDHENYGPALSGECSPAEAQRIAEAIEAVDGTMRPAFLAYVGLRGDLEEAAESFEEAYAGEWDSEREYAEHEAEELVMPHAYRDDDLLVRYFNYDAFARDLFMSDYTSAPSPSGPGGPAGVFVFRNL